MSETIAAKTALGHEATWKTAVLKVGKGAANAPSNGTVIPAGYPLFESSVNGQEYDVFNKTGIAAAIVDTKGTAGTSTTDVAKKIAILLEPWTVSATQVDLKVAYAGDFDLNAIYEACGTTLLPVADVTKKMMRNASGHIVFYERTAVNYAS